jgi:hypothetical protein
MSTKKTIKAKTVAKKVQAIKQFIPPPAKYKYAPNYKNVKPVNNNNMPKDIENFDMVFTTKTCDSEDIPQQQQYPCVKCKTPIKQLNYNVIVSQKSRKSDFICDDCYKSHVFSCRGCSANFLEDLKETYGYCSYCVEQAPANYIYDYNTKVENNIGKQISNSDKYRDFQIKFQDSEYAGKIFKDKHPDSFVVTSNGVYPTLFGIELELACINQGLGVLQVKDLVSNFAQLKKDSTLKAVNGFEIVSAPGDKRFHRECWKELFNSIEHNDNLYCADYIPPKPGEEKGSGCGCHIHISKDSMMNNNGYGKFNGGPGLAIGKLVSFIHHKNNRKFVEIIAGRKSNMFSNFTTKRGFQTDKDGRVTQIKDVTHLPGDFNGHRTAINIHSSNNKTIEFRIFRSTKNYNELMKNIDFVDALCAFCRTGNSSLQEMSNWYNFYQFVCRNRRDYKFLYKFFNGSRSRDIPANEEFRKLLELKENNIDPPEEKEDVEEEIKNIKNIAVEADNYPPPDIHPILVDNFPVWEIPAQLKKKVKFNMEEIDDGFEEPDPTPW